MLFARLRQIFRRQGPAGFETILRLHAIARPGIEQFLNGDLKGSPGQLKAITDANGVPLVASKDNMIEEPESGKGVVLTIDVSMQKQLEDYLR